MIPMSPSEAGRWRDYLSYLRVTLLPYQVTLAESLLAFPYTAKVTQCRQSGKSFVLALIAYFLAYVYKWDIVIAAPKLEQTWHIMRHVHKAQNRVRAKTHYDNRYSLSLRGRGSIQCLSGSETANVEGSSAHVVIIDEHQKLLSSYAAEIFLPMLSWTEGLYWSCGIGGPPHTVAERANVDFVWSLPYDKVVDVKPGYQRLVDEARREEFPEVFAANYECKSLDISAHLLVPSIRAYDTWDGKARTIVGIDWGKRIDRSIATVVDVTPEASYITSWLAPTGTYDEQITQLVKWLQTDVSYNAIIPEANGVGDSSCDFFIAAMKDPMGREQGVKPLMVDQDWKTEQAKKVNKMAAKGTLLYNPNHDLAGPFVKDITQVNYKMLDSDHVKCDHSDFLSSLFLALHEPGVAYL